MNAMETNELMQESFDYDQFFSENMDDYHAMTFIDLNSTNENLLNLNNNINLDPPTKNRTTGNTYVYNIVNNA